MPSQEFLQRPGNIWETYPFDDRSTVQARAEMEQLVAGSCLPPGGVRWESGTLGGVPGKWVFPPEKNDGVVLYFHGGNFILGSSGLTLPFLVELCKILNVTAFSADYALAPERPFPAAQNDALSAYRGLLQLGYGGENIILAGDTAGANLALGLVHAIRQAHLAPPRAVVAVSAPVDCTAISERCSDSLPGTQDILKIYAPDADPSDPRLSPIFSDLSHFAPTLLVAGGAEPLLDDSLQLAQALIHAGCEVELLVGRDMIRSYPLDFTDYPEAAEAFSEIAAYIRIRLGLEEQV